MEELINALENKEYRTQKEKRSWEDRVEYLQNVEARWAVKIKALWLEKSKEIYPHHAQAAQDAGRKQHRPSKISCHEVTKVPGRTQDHG